MSLPVNHSVDSDGIGWIVFDDPDGRVDHSLAADRSHSGDRGDPVVAHHDRLAAAAGRERGDQLRRQAESLAYRSAMDHVADLHRIENTLVASVARDWDYSGPGTVHALAAAPTAVRIRDLVREPEIGYFSSLVVL